MPVRLQSTTRVGANLERPRPFHQNVIQGMKSPRDTHGAQIRDKATKRTHPGRSPIKPTACVKKGRASYRTAVRLNDIQQHDKTLRSSWSLAGKDVILEILCTNQFLHKIAVENRGAPKPSKHNYCGLLPTKSKSKRNKQSSQRKEMGTWRAEQTRPVIKTHTQRRGIRPGYVRAN